MTAIDLLFARRRRASLAQSAQLERYAFHGTSKAILKAVRAVGLVPQVGSNTASDEGKDVEAKVCLAAGKKTAKAYANADGQVGVILRVNLDHPAVASNVPQVDKFTPNAVTVNRIIPPEAIDVVEASRVTPQSEFLLWAMHPKLPILSREHDHISWFQDHGLPTRGPECDKIPRGRSEVDHASKRVMSYVYRGRHSNVVPDEVDRHIRSAYPGYEHYTDNVVEAQEPIPERVAGPLNRLRLGEAYARDHQPSAHFSEAGDWRPNPEETATRYGFNEVSRRDMGGIGYSVQYRHPSGANLILARRRNLESLHMPTQSNWDLNWEYHSMDGVKSSGRDVWGMENHLKSIHGEH